MSSFIDESVEIVKYEMVLYFVIDVSGSMEREKIGAVNNAIFEIIPTLKEVGGSDVSLKIAVLMFSTGCSWMTEKPIPVEDFIWNNVTAGGLTQFGHMCKELNSKLSRSVYMNSPSASVAPVIILLSDGMPTDEYVENLKTLKSNDWFKNGIRIAIAIGSDCDLDVLSDFTGSPEGVITVYTPEALKKLIRVVTLASSEIGSKSQTADNGGIKSKQKTTIKEIQDNIQSEGISTLPDFDDEFYNIIK